MTSFIGSLFTRTSFDNKRLGEAVNLWCTLRHIALLRYGHISSWDVSQVTDMSELFRNWDSFNEDISRWDVSKVTDMSSMFRNASGFKASIGQWNVSGVFNMSKMFEG
eukprot:gene16590-18875_t